ncbi:MAG: glycosyltransferase family 4 protein [Sedimentisphaerales bacterium]|jgi:glycosyltransferase involved in cell wall biosynthesis
MKILMLNYEFPPIGGGAGQAHLAILRQFAGQEDLSVDVLTSAPKPGFSKQNLSDNVTIYTVGVHKKNLHFWRKIEVVEWVAKAYWHYKRLIKENEYDLVHAFFGLPTGWLCYKTADRLPYIISLRGSDVPGEHSRLQLEYKLLGPLLKKIWIKAAGLVACSEGLKKRSLRFLPSVKIDVIPNGVDLNRFRPGAGREINDEMKLLTVGRLSVTKRFDMLIEAVRILHDKGKPVRLTMAGGGGLFEELKEFVERNNLNGIINLTGRIETEKMPDIYRQHDIFVTATMQEGMSNAMLEAMASGLPIITTRCEGVEELISDNGIVVEGSSAEALAGAISKLYEDKQGYRTMSIAARQRAEKFGWDRVAEQYRQLYKKVCEQKSK